MAGVKEIWKKLVNVWDLKGDNDPAYIIYLMRKIYNVLEDVYSIGSLTEFQEAIDKIASGAGTIFIEAGTYEITTPININGGGSIVIYGHGNNSILKPDDLISVFNITNATSLVIQNIKLDLTNYTGNTHGIIANETSNNFIAFYNVTIVGNNKGIGIELQSDNCIIDHCDITKLSKGIYLNGSNYNSITNNNIQNNKNGIYIHDSSYNEFSENVCKDNDSNTASNTAGFYIDGNSDHNRIFDNSIKDNNNAGAGTAYGVYIATATCEKNIIKDNEVSGNDAQWKDNGTNTDIEYLCYTGQDIQDAIDSIGNKAGTIKILTGTITVSTTIDVDQGGIYIIEGEGDNTVLEASNTIRIFNITSAFAGTIIRKIKLDLSNYTGNNIGIYMNIGTSDPVFFEDITITGDGTHGTGIACVSVYGSVVNCRMDNLNEGVYLYGGLNSIERCLCTACGYGIHVYGNYNKVTNNICSNNDSGIYIHGTTYTLVSNNVIYGNTTNGILVASSGSLIIAGNRFHSNGTDINNSDGSGIALLGDDTAYGASWNANLGTPTKNAVYDKIESLVGSGWSGWFDDGANFRITVVNGIITDVQNSSGGGHNP